MSLTTIQLYSHQQDGLDFLISRRGIGCLFAEMGTGKTRMALAYANEVEAKRILVVGPIGASYVWEQELYKVNLMQPFDQEWHPANNLVRVRNLVAGPLSQRAQMLQFEMEQSRYDARPLFVLVNYEGVWRSPLANVILAWKPDLIIWDEAHRLKDRNTRQSKFAYRLSHIAPQRIALTGSPVANGHQDLFGIYRAIDQRVFGTRWADFASRYLVMGGYMNHSIKGYQREDEIGRLVAETSYQVSKDEALDLPERTDIIVPVELSSATRRKYDEFKKNAIAEIEGTDEDGRPIRGTVLARIVLVSILRLQQITNGFASTDEGIIDLGDDKLRTCTELATDAVTQGSQVVIFARFIHDLERISSALPGAVAIHGQVTPREREAIRQRFASGLIKVLVCQIQIASTSIDLTAANVAIFYSTGHSLIDFHQARDRLHRLGQTRKVTYYHLVGKKTVDEKTYRDLQKKVSIAGRVVNLGYAKEFLS